MANNYLPTVTAGQDTSWVQATQIVIDAGFNPAAPTQLSISATIVEQEVFALASGQFFIQPFPPGLAIQEINYTDTFNLLDANGNVVGTATDAQLFAMLHSKYVALAQARDAAGAIGG